MKTRGKMRKLLSMALALVMMLALLPAEARAAEIVDSGTCGAQGDNLTWTLDSNGVLRISGSGEMADHDAGGSPWYENRTSIQTVVLGSGVTSIGAYAFYNCTGITEIHIPDNILSIGEYAFYECFYLSSVVLPRGINALSTGVFYNCEALESITIPNGVKSICQYAFAGCLRMSSVTIPYSVTSIGKSAFVPCVKLTDVFYEGTVEDWARISFDQAGSNQFLLNANLHTIDSLVMASGLCGEQANSPIWTLYGNGVLTISGCADMPSWGINNAPWKSVISSIKKVIIMPGVYSISDYAFLGCSNLNNAIIANGVFTISNNAFMNCTNLLSIDVVPGNTNFCSVDGVLFNKELTELIICPAGKTGDYSVPEGVATIDSVAFANCSRLTRVTISENVSQIGSQPFFGCQSMLDIHVNSGNNLFRSENGVLFNHDMSELIAYPAGKLGEYAVPESVHVIGSFAFQGCSHLTSLIVPASVQVIGENAFNGCTLNNVYFYGTSQQWEQIEVNWGNEELLNAPLHLNGSTDPVIISSGECGAEGDNLTWTLDTNGLLTISGKGEMSDYETGTVFEVAPWDSYETIIKSIVILEGVTSIGDWAFSDCSSLSCISMPESIVNIGGWAFFGCSSLSEVTIPKGVTGISQYAFYNCTNLKKITIPESVCTIGKWAFYNCYLVNVKIPYGVTDINDWTFYGCSQMASITIPSSVSSIGDWAFSHCDRLTNVYYGGSEEQWNSITIGEENECLTGATIHYNSHSEPINNDGSENLRLDKCVSVFFDSTMNGRRTVNGLTYDDAWFTQNSYAYNHDLATMTLGLAMSAFERKEDDEPYSTEDGTDNVESLFAELGFLPNTFEFPNYHMEDDGKVGIAMAAKTIYDLNGSPVPLLAVALRGGGYGDGGWAGNFEVGNSFKYHDGFYKAADNTATTIREYIDAKGIDRSKLRIWLTGYSRSAATANLVSQLLSLRGTCMRENIYTYTFATPSNQVISGFSDTYNNIFNILNPIDIVTMIPPLQWNFGKQGKSIYTLSPFPYYYSGSQGAAGTLFSDFQSLFRTISGCETYNYADCQPLLIEILFDFLMDAFGSRETYYQYMQYPMVQFERHDYSAIDEEILCGITSVEELKELFKLGKDNEQLAMLNATNTVEFVKYNGLAALNYAKMASKLVNVISYRDEAFGPSDPYLKIIETLWKLLKQKAGALALGLFGTTVGTSDADFVFDILSRGFESDALMQHFPEVYMAWMMTCEEGNMAETHAYKTRVATVKCPVDVEVYAEEGNLVARTRTETYTVEDEDTGEVFTDTFTVLDTDVTTLDVVIYGDSRYFTLPDDQNYRFEIVTNDSFASGNTMSYSVTDYEDGTAAATVSYDGILLTENTSFEAQIMAGDMQVETCTISDGTQALAPTGLVLPADTVRIEEGAFENYSSLTEVTIPSGVKEIGSNAFKDCSNLTDILFLPKSGLTSIGNYAFSGCSAMTAITIPAGVTSIGDFAFEGCVGMTDVYYSGTEAQWAMITVGAGNEILTDATIHCGAWTITWKNDDGTIIDTTTVEDGILPTYDAPAKPADNEYDYFFNGWDPEVKAATKDMVYTAQFTAKQRQYVVSFDANGGEGTMEPQKLSADELTALSPNAFTRSGYTFTGWNTKTDGSGTAYADGDEIVLSTDLTLYAQWESTISVSSITANKTNANVGDLIIWTAETTDGTGTLQYRFHIYKGETLIQEGSYGTAKTFSYTPAEAGTYQVKVIVKDTAGNQAELVGGSVEVIASTAPALVSATASVGQITVKWNAVTGATKYAVYRKTAADTGWTQLTNTITDTSYADKSTDLIVGTTYYYTVRAYINGAWGDFEKPGVKATAVATTAPALVSATASVGQITVKWNAVTGATKYAVYRKTAADTGWTRLTNTITGTSYADNSTDLIVGTTYYYTVRAYINGAWGDFEKPGVKAKAVATTAPALVSATASVGQITVKWNAVTGATKYAVYRKTAADTGWTRLTNTITGTSYTDKSTDLIVGTTYYYTVRAYINGAWGDFEKPGVKAKAVSAVVAKPAITAQPANKTVAAGTSATFKVVASGTGLTYQWQYSKNGTTWTNKSGATSASYTVTAKESYNGMLYRCKITNAGGTVVTNTAKLTVTSPATPVITSIKADKTNAATREKVTWTAAATGGTGTLQYYFIIYKDGTKVKTRAYSTTATFSYTPTEAGTYKAKVYVKDAAETKANKTSAAVSVIAGPLTVTSIKADKTSSNVGRAITWTVAASGGEGTLQYYFRIYKDGNLVQKGSYGTTKTYMYIPIEAGTYKAKVYVKEADGTVVSKTSAAVTVS